ncbi:MAG: hypothetical protein SFW09_18240 [Hyphomicrobiaceae bacterium]|nr:hypothetical protein [Hyphomicrobiaceae bacterium]
MPGRALLRCWVCATCLAASSASPTPAVGQTAAPGGGGAAPAFVDERRLPSGDSDSRPRADEERRRTLEEEARRAAEEARERVESEARTLRERLERDAAEHRKRLEAEAEAFARQLQAEAEARRKDEEALRSATAAAQAAEAEARRKAEEEVQARAEAERHRLAAEAEARRKAEEEARAEAERQRLATEAEARRKAEENRRKALQVTGNPADAPRHLARGRELLKAGDIVSARLFLERASDAGSADAAFQLAETYDAIALQRLGAVGISANAEMAERWYARAAALGSAAAAGRLKQSGGN